MADNKVKFGLEKVHVAFFDEELGTFEEPQHIPGAVNLALTGEGEPYTFYADNIAYYVVNSNNGYSGDLEMALIPDWFSVEALGWEIDDNGMVVEVADGKQKPFALLYEVKGDQNNKRYIYYNCMSSKPTEEHSTETESREVNTQTLTINVSAKEFNNKNVIKGAMELSLANATAFNSFFDEVQEPTFAGGGEE